MIFYFSATGNCRYVAEQIARRLDDRAISIVGSHADQAIGGDVVGFVFPTYFWGLPSVAAEFLQRAQFSDCGYLFIVSTYGTTPGASGKLAEAMISGAGKRFDAMFSVVMPDTWTPIFDLSDPARVRRILRAGDAQLQAVIQAIQARQRGVFVRRVIPSSIARIAGAIYDRARRTDTLRAGSACIGCGLCARVCPVKAIAMQGGRPVWVKERCAMCLGCLHRCPTFAIQRGSRTRRHGQYQNPHVKW